MKKFIFILLFILLNISFGISKNWNFWNNVNNQYLNPGYIAIDSNGYKWITTPANTKTK